jgi:hypothetical protein
MVDFFIVDNGNELNGRKLLHSIRKFCTYFDFTINYFINKNNFKYADQFLKDKLINQLFVNTSNCTVLEIANSLNKLNNNHVIYLETGLELNVVLQKDSINSLIDLTKQKDFGIAILSGDKSLKKCYFNNINFYKKISQLIL